MHELGIATEIYRVSRRTGDERGAGPLERVKVAVGELSAVEPDLLRFAWEAVVRDGPDAGAFLEIDWRPARQICKNCGDVPERTGGTWLRLCPRCRRALRVDGGDELDILTCVFAAPAERSDDVHGTRAGGPEAAGSRR